MKCIATVSLYTETHVYADRYKERGCKSHAVAGTQYCKSHQRKNVPSEALSAGFEALKEQLRSGT